MDTFYTGISSRTIGLDNTLQSLEYSPVPGYSSGL